jgi:hypothetical protein
MQDSGKLRTSATGRGPMGFTNGGLLRRGRQSGVLGLVAGRVPETVPCLLPNGYRVIERCRDAITDHPDIKFICRGEKQA